MMTRRRLQSIKLAWTTGVACGLVLFAGCRQAPHRDESPTPIAPSVIDPTWEPAAVPELPPSLPPAQEQTPREEILLPPPPGTALRPLDALEEFGGFTPAKSLNSEAPSGPALLDPSEDLIPVPTIRSVAGEVADTSDETLELPSLELEAIESPATVQVLEDLSETVENDNSSVTTPDAPARPWIRPRTTNPIALDASLFVSELMIEGPTTSSTVPAPKSATKYRPASAPMPVTLPLLIPDEEHDLAFEEPQRVRTPSWPQSGLPYGMVINPGPITEKWAPQPLPVASDRSPSLPPQRLATENSDWDSRPIQ